MRRAEQRFTSGDTSKPKVIGVPPQRPGESMGDYTNRLTQHRKDMLNKIDHSGITMGDIFGDAKTTAEEVRNVTTFDISGGDHMAITLKLSLEDFTNVFDYILAQSQTGDANAKRIFLAIALRMAQLVTSSANPDELHKLLKFLQDDDE